ncbi:8384_t:CDS:1, partial [Cetraspora pellucida]
KVKNMPLAELIPNNLNSTNIQQSHINNKEQSNPDDQHMDTESVVTIASDS